MKYAFFTLLFLLAGLCPAQNGVQLMEDAGGANLPAQRIGADDLIAISVYRSPELTRTVRVDADGTIALPLLANPIPAAGSLPKELESSIARALKEEGILVDPVVEVTVAEYASRPISVMGAVRKPLTFQAVGRVTLLDALAKAEGLAPEAAREIVVTLPAGREGAEPEVRRIPVEDLIDNAQPELNLRLEGGEEILVPEAGRIFVVGNVKKPGSYAVPDPTDASVLTLIALAEGMEPYARNKAYIYRLEPETGVRREIEIELSRILKRKIPDVPLQIDDVLYIPDNSGKRTAAHIFDRVATFGTSTVSGILIWNR